MPHRQREHAASAYHQNHDLIQAFAAKRANPTFGCTILPRRARRYQTIADSHHPNPGGEDMPVARSLPRTSQADANAQGNRLGDLSRQPGSGRMPRHLKPQQLSPAPRIRAGACGHTWSQDCGRRSEGQENKDAHHARATLGVSRSTRDGTAADGVARSFATAGILRP
jgi:hypothetical protein